MSDKENKRRDEDIRRYSEDLEKSITHNRSKPDTEPPSKREIPSKDKRE